jgi:hypothetical protein
MGVEFYQVGGGGAGRRGGRGTKGRSGAQRFAQCPCSPCSRLSACPCPPPAARKPSLHPTPPHPTPPHQPPTQPEKDVDDFCEEHPDVVILASSILSTADVLRGLPVQRLRRNTLFVDVLSVKVWGGGFGQVEASSWEGKAGARKGKVGNSSRRAPPRPPPAAAPPPPDRLPLPPPPLKAFPKQLLLRELPPEMDILCTHPMFGPDSGKGSWRGLNFMYEVVRVGHDGQRLARIENFLRVRSSSPSAPPPGHASGLRARARRRACAPACLPRPL